MSKQKIISKKGSILVLKNQDIVEVDDQQNISCVDICYFGKICMQGRNNNKDRKIAKRLFKNLIRNIDKYSWCFKSRGCFLQPGLYFKHIEGGI